MKSILPLLLIILSVALFYVYIDPTYAEIRTLQSEESEYVRALDSAKKLEETKTVLVNKYNTFSGSDLSRLEKMVPYNIDNVKLAAEINGIAEKYDIVIKAIRIQEGQPGSEVGGNITESSSDTFRTLSMTFSFSTTYVKFLQFIDSLESNLRLVDFPEVSFNASAAGTTYTYEVTIKTYWLP